MNWTPGFNFIWPPLLISTLISISSPTWLILWGFLEINMFSFLIILIFKPTPITRETTVKYLITQATRSSIIILSAILSSISTHFLIKFLIFTTVIFKLGAAPFHQWFLSVAKALPTFSFIILLTWQKILPLCLIYAYFTKTKILLILTLLNAFVGAMGGLNQTTLRPLLCYSSINHIGWIIIAIKNSLFTTALYVLTYFYILITLINTNISSTPLNQWAAPNIKKPKLYTNIAALPLLSLAGIPPTIGFIIKWLVLYANSLNFFIITNLIFTTIITLLYYIIISLVNTTHIYSTHTSSIFSTQNKYLILHLIIPIIILLLI